MTRRPVYFNPAAKSWTTPLTDSPELAYRFHSQLPAYSQTNLVPLKHLAEELGVGAVHLKDETCRLGLPSFKILGASWGTFRATAQRLGLPLDSSLDSVKQALKSTKISLYAATDGNHGRAVARMASILGVTSQIHVPVSMHSGTIDLIKSEGAHVVVSDGFYDAAVVDARVAATQDKTAIVVQDYASGDYVQIPQWIVDGYLTMMLEIDGQLGSTTPDLVVVPVGVGSFAQAVVTHFKKAGKQTTVLTVEPDTSASLWKSLRRGESSTTSEKTPSIMAGLDCGTPSSISWDILRHGVDASLTVSDFEAHQACSYLISQGVSAGPCGAAPIAALRRLSSSDRETLGLTKDSVVVVFCTEGPRDYSIPHDVASDDPVELTQTLVRINSANPSMGSIPGPGETAVARYISAWMEHRDIEAHWIEPTPGRPSVVGVARGSGGGKSLMLNGHIDTVTLVGYEGDPLNGDIIDGKLYGRGAADMKCGIAAAMVTLANAKQQGLSGDVIFTGVADEEFESIGTQQVLEAGWRADGAIVSEPTNMDILYAHKGFVWFEVDIHGLASHGSRYDLGIDAICKAGYFLVELDKHASNLTAQPGDSVLGPGSIHASIINGGEEVSSYPAFTQIQLERRTVNGETPETVTKELENILDGLVKTVPDFKYSLRTTFHRSSFKAALDHPFSQLVRKHVSVTLGEEPVISGAPYWTDSALLADAGIPTLLWGPKGEGLHGKLEYADVESIKQVTETLTAIAVEFCS
ncbi:pyridoxal-phosphate dependent enzyme domain-containing protein [Trichoderma breve]|uniref:Probable succinyl-diaminopimelate desuccinylase n=1 Tax=Trichoderma breve TaxID=2034170 RepID=A0A9W9EBE2_9HYPO|nr:pyridoxal-phosphate dependent enzyme domain-containing protein [Trichoderma breve]KAJ4863556.1 pyridoxal-phosphate dependent enzyme domain-containing protein [Trichoderma breve]